MKRIVYLGLSAIILTGSIFTAKAFFRDAAYAGALHDPKAAAHNVTNAYYELPLEYLIQIKNYIQRKKAENPRDRTTDGKDLRKAFIKDKNEQKGYLHLQWPGDLSYTRLQYFKNKDSSLNFMAVETYECRPSCKSTFLLLEKDSTVWRPAKDRLPAFDKKYIKKLVRDAYKKEFKDLEIYEEYGYNDIENLISALEYTIVPEKERVIVREPKLQLELYNIHFDDTRDVFFLTTP